MHLIFSLNVVYNYVYMCVLCLSFLFIDLSFFHIFSFFFFMSSLLSCFNILFHFFQVTKVLFITSLPTPPFKKKCGNCHVANVIINDQQVMFIITFVIQNQRFKNQVSIVVPL